MTFYRFGGILEYEGRGADFISKKPDMSGMVEGFGKESLPKGTVGLKLSTLGIYRRGI